MLIVNTFMFFYISIMVFLRQRLEAEKYNFDLDQYENRAGLGMRTPSYLSVIRRSQIFVNNFQKNDCVKIREKHERRVTGQDDPLPQVQL